MSQQLKRMRENLYFGAHFTQQMKPCCTRNFKRFCGILSTELNRLSWFFVTGFPLGAVKNSGPGALAPVFHARHYRVPSKVPNGPSSRILLAARSSSTSFHARLFDSVVRFGVSAGGAARLWCSTTIFFAKIYQFLVGFGNLYREAPFPRGWVVSCSRCSRARHFARHIC